jgi:DNA-binding transcriptional LysR family regulator
MAEEAATAARRVAKGEQGALTIGFTAAAGYGLLPDLVRRLRERVPGVSLTLKEVVTTAQIEALDAGQLDLGLMRPHAEHGELETRPVAAEALMLALPERDAAQWPQQCTLDCLHQKPFLMYSPYEARYFFQLLNDCFDRAGVMPDIVEHVGQIHTMLALVSSGVGAALIPEAAARLQFNGIILRKMAMDPAKPVETVCSWRRDNDNPILQIFKRAILRPIVR